MCDPSNNFELPKEWALTSASVQVPNLIWFSTDPSGFDMSNLDLVIVERHLAAQASPALGVHY